MMLRAGDSAASPRRASRAPAPSAASPSSTARRLGLSADKTARIISTHARVVNALAISLISFVVIEGGIRACYVCSLRAHRFALILVFLTLFAGALAGQALFNKPVKVLGDPHFIGTAA